MTNAPKKKLIETSLPLEAINEAAIREGNIRQGKPASLHQWWARQPHSVTRSILFAQLVDDPSSRPDLFPTNKLQEEERKRLHEVLSQLAQWENLSNEDLYKTVREEILKSNDGVMPSLADPFAGGGAIPLEAHRLGLDVHASDLNPVAVLINKSLIDIPARFSGSKPIHPDSDEKLLAWSRSEGLAEDIRQYGRWMKGEAERRLSAHYPKVQFQGVDYPVVAWIWARTVKSPNPANPVETPLVRSWWLSKKKGREAFVLPKIGANGDTEYKILNGKDPNFDPSKGTVSKSGAFSLGDGTAISLDYIRAEGQAGRIGAHLIAVVAKGPNGRFYLEADERHISAAEVELPADLPIGALPEKALGFRVQAYGYKQWTDLFTRRQLLALTTFSDLIGEVHSKVVNDAKASGMPAGLSLEKGGTGALAYADGIATYLSFAIDKLADLNNTFTTWNPVVECPNHLFTRQSLPMVWDYPEANPLSDYSGSFSQIIRGIANAVSAPSFAPGDVAAGEVSLVSADERSYSNLVVSTDPPYYDNIGYADLSDFFYVWLRRSLRSIYRGLTETILTFKDQELISTPYRHETREDAKQFFVDGFNRVFGRIREDSDGSVPLTVYYAYKQQDSKGEGASSTGWYTLLEGLIGAGWEITATWPVRSERSARMVGIGSNALASSIVLACRPRPETASSTTRCVGQILPLTRRGESGG